MSRTKDKRYLLDKKVWGVNMLAIVINTLKLKTTAFFFALKTVVSSQFIDDFGSWHTKLGTTNHYF